MLMSRLLTFLMLASQVRTGLCYMHYLRYLQYWFFTPLTVTKLLLHYSNNCYQANCICLTFHRFVGNKKEECLSDSPSNAVTSAPTNSTGEAEESFTQ